MSAVHQKETKGVNHTKNKDCGDGGGNTPFTGEAALWERRPKIGNISGGDKKFSLCED